MAAVRAWRPDLGLSIGAPILREELFSIPRLGTLNIHGGKVPDFRGAPPGFWELYTGANEIGATLHWVTRKLDSGAVVEQAVAPIYEHDSLNAVSQRAEELSVRVLERGLRAVVSGEFQASPQPAGGRTFRAPTVATRLRLQVRLSAKRIGRLVAMPSGLAKNLVLGVLVYLYRPLRDTGRAALGTHPVRVFTFHRVTNLCRDGMTVSPETFRRQIRFLKSTHDIRTLRDAVEILKSDRQLRKPVAVVTFDDGYRSVYEYACRIMEEEGVVGTCFLSTSLVSTDDRFAHDECSPVARFLEVMNWAEVEDLIGRGWDMGGHTRTHRRVSELRGSELGAEIEGPMRDLEEHAGVRASAFAYPFGMDSDISSEAEVLTTTAGYAAAFQDYGGDARATMPFQRLPRTELGGDHSTLAWKARAVGFDLRRMIN